MFRVRKLTHGDPGETPRQSGIDLLGNLPWGKHFCLFYMTNEDMLELLVPYIRAGLENNEFCMWVTSGPLDHREAEAAMKKAVPDFDEYIKKGQIEILPHTMWYLKEGKFDAERVLNGWNEKLDHALANGYDGLRLTANTFWLEKANWSSFADYEAAIDAIISDHNMIAFCTYSLEKCGASEVIEVAANHEFTLIRRMGNWEVIEMSGRRRSEHQIESLARFPSENPNPVLRVAADGAVLYANSPALSVLTGYGSGLGEPLPKAWRKLVLKSVTSRTSQTLEVQQKGRTFSFDVAPVPGAEYVNVYGRDVTDLKRLQAKEIQAAAVLAAARSAADAVNAMGDGVLLVDMKDGAITAVNPALENMIGYTRDSLVGASIRDITKQVVHRDDLEVAEASLKSALAGTLHPPLSLTLLSKDRREVPVILAPAFIRSPRGKPKTLVATIKDMSELQQAQAAFRKSQAGLSEAQRLAHVGSWEWNVLTNKIVWSDEVYRILGFHPQEFGASYDAFLALVHPEDRQAVQETVNRALSDPDFLYSIEHRVVRPDGAERVLHERGEVTFDDTGKSVRMIGTVQDITEIKRAEEALRTAKDFLQHVIDGMPDPMMVIDRDHRILLANQAAQRFAGQDPVASSLKCFQVFHRRESPCNPPLEPCPLERAVATKKPVELIHRHIGPDGEDRIFDVTAAPIVDASGEVIQVIESCRDVTERKRVESEARRLRNELYRVTRVGMIGELTASIAHELNQPLAAILSNAQAAQRFLMRDPPDLEEVGKALSRIARDDRRAGNVIHHLRELLKGEAPGREPVDICEIVQGIISLLHSELLAREVSVTLEAQDDLPPVLADPIQLQQLMMNLFLNAMEAMDDEEPDSRQLIVRVVKSDSETIEVAVQDGGKGLDEKTIDDVFDPFFTTKSGGLGVGLSISRSIIHAHGGQLWATNNADRGATFHFTLPLGEGESRDG